MAHSILLCLNYSGQLGGLLALCLGASVVTVLELADMTLRCACLSLLSASSTKNKASKSRQQPPPSSNKSSNKSSISTNHVMFKAVDTNDVISSDDIPPITSPTLKSLAPKITSSSIPSSSAASVCAPYHRAPPPPALSIQTVKIDGVRRMKYRRNQAETDI